MSHLSSDLLQSAPIEEQEGATAPQAGRSRIVFYTYFALFIAILCAYAGVAGCDFVYADDTGYIHHNPFVQSGLSWENVRTAVGSFYGSLWIPLTWLSFMLDVSLFGRNPMGFHIENLLLHAATALLLLRGLHRATGRFWPSAVVAALFGLHPINVESVAWVVERKNVLCAFFWVLSTNAYLRYGATGQKRSYWWALAWFALALMSKPMAVTLPGTLFLLDLWPLRRDLSRWRCLLLEKIPFIILSAGACLLAMEASRENDTLVSHGMLPMTARISNALVSYPLYLRDFFWPANLSAFYPYPIDAQPVLAGVSLVILLVITAGAIWLYRSRPYLLVGWLWFLGVLVPMIGLVQVGSQARADRFTYLAQIGIFVAVVWWIADLCSQRRKRLVSAVSVVVLVVLAGKTAADVQYWTDTATLFERAIEKAGPSTFSHILAGRARSRQGEDLRAAEHFAAALRIQPDVPDVWCSYGRALKNLKRRGEAIRAFGAAIRLEPKYAEVRYLLALTLEDAGHVEPAIAQLREAARLEPGAAQVHEALARILARKGASAEAERHTQEAVRLRAKPNSKFNPDEEADQSPRK